MKNPYHIATLTNEGIREAMHNGETILVLSSALLEPDGGYIKSTLPHHLRPYVAYASGAYKGEREPSLIVRGYDPFRALIRAYGPALLDGQESVLVVNGMRGTTNGNALVAYLAKPYETDVATIAPLPIFAKVEEVGVLREVSTAEGLDAYTYLKDDDEAVVWTTLDDNEAVCLHCGGVKDSREAACLHCGHLDKRVVSDDAREIA